MAGHSKWAQIKRKKAATDAKRGRLFTRLLREIQVAARVGGGNVEGNPRLKTAIQTAKSYSVPADNIDRAVKRGAGASEGDAFEEINYEGYGPGGVALIIKSMTDNRNRTVSEIRHALSRHKGTLGTTNSVAHNFVNKGVLSLPRGAMEEDQLIAVALEAGAEDVQANDGTWEVFVPPAEFNAVRRALEEHSSEVQGEIRLEPVVTVPVAGETAEDLLKLLDVLDDLDDVQSVVANFEIDESELGRLES
ncbi:MAG: YebC/PmpR family DNA-binding transcriptional regulator [Deltaproteobacteria bacterium]|nr:YebC/PmpR family DNA-binding transcriptional regulator [Deltaproteobacteria bacterium]